MDKDWEVIGVQSGEGALLRVHDNVEGGYCEVRKGGVAVGRQAGGESVLRSRRSELVRESWKSVPCSAALVSEVCEYQEGWWALKSPMIMESSWDWRSWSKEGVKV